ncbi:unnamed protein product, partial [marine sediment metagenome]
LLDSLSPNRQVPTIPCTEAGIWVGMILAN